MSLHRLSIVLALTGCGYSSPDVEPAASHEEALSRGAVIFNSCGNAGTAPQIFSNAFMSPTALNPGGSAPMYWNPSNGRYTRAGIQYVSGNGIRMEMVTDKCTFIQSVTIGSTTVTPTYTNGYWYSAQASTSQPTDTSRYGYNLWVFFPYQGDGSTDTVTINVGRVGGGGTTAYRFPLVRVDSVEASNVDAAINFTRAELFNMFGKALYEKFNGALNSTHQNPDDPESRRIYGYNPASLQMSVDSTGVSFAFNFKAEVNNWCDPTVRAQGKFKLNANSAGISVNWVTPATGNLSWPFLCEAVQVIPILGAIPIIIYDIVESNNGKSVAASVEKAVKDSLPDSSSFNAFLNGSTVSSGQLLIKVKLPVPSIGIHTPYDAFDMVRGSVLFPYGDVVTLLASGMGMNDYVANVSPTTTLYSGPNGVPKAGTPTWPNPLSVARSGNLVWNSQPVGRLLVRRSDIFSIDTYTYTAGCSIKLPTAGRIPSVGRSPYLKFGANDTVADAQRLRGIFGAAPGYLLRASFLSELGPLADTAPRCGSFNSAPVVSSAQ